MIKTSVLGCVLLLLAACSNTPTGVEACPEPRESSPDYVIGAGDTLQIFVWRHDELTTTIPVRPDGKISIPLVEDVIVVGKTPTALARDMEEELAEYLRTPKVNIIVIGQGISNQIQIVGNVTSPMAIPYQDGIRMLDAMIAVGGLDTTFDWFAPQMPHIPLHRFRRIRRSKMNVMGGSCSGETCCAGYQKGNESGRKRKTSIVHDVIPPRLIYSRGSLRK